MITDEQLDRLSTILPEPAVNHAEVTPEMIIDLFTLVTQSTNKFRGDAVLAEIAPIAKGLVLSASNITENDKKAYSLISNYISELESNNTVERKWRPHQVAHLSAVAKRRYWRHKNTYKRTLQYWKKKNAEKLFMPNLANQASAFKESTEKVQKDQIVYLMKAISSAFTHFTIGLDYFTELFDIVEGITDLTSAALLDLSSLLDSSNIANESVEHVNAIYSNCLFLMTEIFTTSNISLTGYQEDLIEDDEQIAVSVKSEEKK